MVQQVSDEPYSILLTSDMLRAKACEAIRRAPDGYIFTIQPPKHSDPQRELMFALLDQLVKRKVMHDGYLMSKEDLKLYFLSGVRPGIRVVRNFNNDGFLCLDRSIRPLRKPEMQKMIDMIVAFADQRGWELVRTIPGYEEVT